MKISNTLCLTAVAACLFSSPVAAQTDSAAVKIVTASYMAGVGGTNVLDTYLSAEHFSGVGGNFLATIERQRIGRRWFTLLEHESHFASVKDRSGSKHELESSYNIYWGRLRSWHLMADRLTLQAGAMVNGTAGVIYNTSNSNNPAQARVHLNIMPTGVVKYQFQLFHRPMLLRYELNLPLCGVMFSPNYGQSYYEIFNRGNYDHNIVPTTFVSSPEWRHMLTLEAELSRRITLRFGYLGNMQQARVNGLRQHVFAHRFLIGITRRFKVMRVGLKDK